MNIYKRKYGESIASGLVHMGYFLYGEGLKSFENGINFLENNEGSRLGCLLLLSDKIAARAMHAYFHSSDLLRTKHYAYLAAKSHIMYMHMIPNDSYLMQELLWPLLSDNEELIDWYRQFSVMYRVKPSEIGGDKDNPKSWLYFRYQAWLALNERWDELGQRAQRILGMADDIKKDKHTLLDHRFFLSLANKDQSGMESALLEMCMPRIRSNSFKRESGVTGSFITSHATLYAKLAWRNGFQVKVDSPWIPQDWLPVAPLDKYEAPWPFMQNFDIWQPFEGQYAHMSPVRQAQPV
jgi:hypothetical protein